MEVWCGDPVRGRCRCWFPWHRSGADPVPTSGAPGVFAPGPLRDGSGTPGSTGLHPALPADEQHRSGIDHPGGWHPGPLLVLLPSPCRGGGPRSGALPFAGWVRPLDGRILLLRDGSSSGSPRFRDRTAVLRLGDGRATSLGRPAGDEATPSAGRCRRIPRHRGRRGCPGARHPWRGRRCRGPRGSRGAVRPGRSRS